jgi:hypothetical protein
MICRPPARPHDQDAADSRRSTAVVTSFLTADPVPTMIPIRRAS